MLIYNNLIIDFLLRVSLLYCIVWIGYLAYVGGGFNILNGYPQATRYVEDVLNSGLSVCKIKHFCR